MNFDCIVIGAGAAGLMCAATAGQAGKKVLVLDHANKVGKKILMSGGGRCNFTNLDVQTENYLSNNIHFCKSALSRYTQWDFIALVDSYGLAYHEKTKGQLFCDHKAKDILNILLAECEKGRVEIRTDCAIHEVNKDENRFVLSTVLGIFTANKLVVATGGLSIPTMGATGFGYDLAKKFGLACTPKHAALVPYTFKGDVLQIAQALAGISVDVVAHTRNQSFREAMLFTHKGVSGPAILQITNYWYPGEAVSIDFLPEIDLKQNLIDQREAGKKNEIQTYLAQYLPKRFVQHWLPQDLQHTALSQLSNKQIEKLSKLFNSWVIVPAGTEGYKTAEVTRGGVDTHEVSSKTFEAKKVNDLYFVGEVLDVTGWLGGFNFQWAWASGYCAGMAISE